VIFVTSEGPRMLTHREQEIVRLLCEGGLSNKEIARKLNISDGTIKVHLHNIYQKLEIKNRTTLVRLWSMMAQA
jgi:DNA-binding NarL/FixJ family response regulator